MIVVNPQTGRLSIPIIVAVLVLTGCSTASGPKLPSTVAVTPFERISSDYTHQWDKNSSFPFSGGAAIDVNGDGKMEVFVSGGAGQNDALLSYQNGKLADLVEASGLSRTVASYGATAIDMNDDGQTDLLVAREDGIWIHMNNDGVFDASLLEHTRKEGETATAVAVSDIDLDGDLDLYISNFITYKSWRSAVFNDPDHVRNNVLLRNDGEMKFTDITSEAQVPGTQNTFLSTFVDLNSDGYQDLVVSNNTGRIEIFENLKDGKFRQINYDSGLGYWMGIGIGDYDADGDQDLAFSNVSNSIPARFVRGDLSSDQVLEQEWVLLRNDGNFEFSNVTLESGLAKQGFGWGIVFEDINLDGNLDVLAAQSYIKWPPHALKPLHGRAMLQVEGDDGRSFINAPSLKLRNSKYGQSAVVADLDGDARQDVVWINMNGPVAAALNRHTGDVVTLAIPENATWSGATIRAKMSDGSLSPARQVTNAVGMQTDQSPHLSFAIPDGLTLTEISIQFPNGKKKILNPSINSLVQVRP